MKRRAARILATSLALGGCTVGPDYHAPQLSVPAGFAGTRAADASSESPVNVRWWSGFRDPVLDQLVDRAVQSNIDLKVARARVREARALRGVVAADLFPHVDTIAGVSRTRWSGNVAGLGGTSGRETNLLQAGFDAGWEVDVFGGTRRAVEAAAAEIDASVEDRRDVLVSLLGEVARNYIELRGLQRRIAVTSESMRSQRDTADLTRSRFDAGISSDLDVARAEAQVASTSAELPSLESSLQQTVHRLGVLLGREPGALRAELATPAAIPPPPHLSVALPSDLLRRRPDLRRAERELAAATARIGVATAELYPSFSLFATAGFQSSQTQDLLELPGRYWSIGPSLRWPLFDGGRVRASIAVQDARAEQAMSQYEGSLLIALEEVENALVAFSRERERARFLAESATSSRRAVDLANELHTRGMVSFLDVLQAEAALFSAEFQLAASETAVSTAVVAVYKALGGGWETFEEPLPPSAGAEARKS